MVAVNAPPPSVLDLVSLVLLLQHGTRARLVLTAAVAVMATSVAAVAVFDKVVFVLVVEIVAVVVVLVVAAPLEANALSIILARFWLALLPSLRLFLLSSVTRR